MYWCPSRVLTFHRSPPVPLKSANRADFDTGSARANGETSHAGRADTRSLDHMGLETALRNCALPMEPAGAVTPVACKSVQDFRRLEPHLKSLLGPVICRTKPADTIEAEILRLRSGQLARRAETRTPRAESCRTWSGRRTAIVVSLFFLTLAALVLLAPTLALSLITIWAVVTLISVTILRSIGTLEAFRHARHKRKWSSGRPDHIANNDLPTISLLVPLFDELNIAGHLVKRLSALDYPRDKLDVCLILEHGDLRTESALKHARIPRWMRIVHVPNGPIQTKPRAMNYALDFTRGEIVGIYDAEDKPARDQLRKVALGFARADPDVACLQGILDFYNASESWLSRCFAIDYAAWFRLVLPGLVRLGMVIPLGGTTVFFRRGALEDLGRWDAHNVTEDADLGLRLARRGYRTQFVQSVTEEEATHRVGPWLRQRSRWIKGYAITWAVHMRDPLRLLGDLGPMRFIGVQIVFLGTLSHFLLAPFLWSFWLILFGFSHPVSATFPGSVVLGIGILFFISEITTLLIAAMAVATPRHAWLIKWVPLMHLYFPLAAVASWKGIAELVTRPFFWDKTAHGSAKPIRTRTHRFRRRRPRRAAAALQTHG